MEKLVQDLFPKEGTVYDILLWYDNLTRRYHEFEWSREYPPVVCDHVFKTIVTNLSTQEYTSIQWINYMKVLDQIQYTSEQHLQLCIQAMLQNTKPVTLVRPQDVREFLRMYPDRDNIPLLRFFILNVQGSDDDIYRRLVLYTIKNEFPIRCYLQSLPKQPSRSCVVDCNINYDDPIFELDLLYLSRI
jgi:hypothetical protein